MSIKIEENTGSSIAGNSKVTKSISNSVVKDIDNGTSDVNTIELADNQESKFSFEYEDNQDQSRKNEEVEKMLKIEKEKQEKKVFSFQNNDSEYQSQNVENEKKNSLQSVVRLENEEQEK